MNAARLIVEGNVFLVEDNYISNGRWLINKTILNKYIADKKCSKAGLTKLLELAPGRYNNKMELEKAGSIDLKEFVNSHKEPLVEATLTALGEIIDRGVNMSVLIRTNEATPRHVGVNRKYVILCFIDPCNKLYIKFDAFRAREIIIKTPDNEIFAIIAAMNIGGIAFEEDLRIYNERDSAC